MNTSRAVKTFVKSRFPRAVSAYRDARQALQGTSLATVFAEIYQTNAWRDPESVSGRGSTLARTNVITSQLPVLLQELNTDSLIDAACGDFNWMRYVDLGSIKYTGVDIVPALIAHNRELYQTDQRTFAVKDITKDRLPDADVILCRDCLIHLSFKSIKAAISNFKKTSTTSLARSGFLCETSEFSVSPWFTFLTKSNHGDTENSEVSQRRSPLTDFSGKASATYLLCTTHTTVTENTDCPDGSWRNLNLLLPPFNFPKPIKLLVEDSQSGKCLGVWRLADL